ncbi:hypothetical protein IJI89_03975 [Candidatus Saccharibacteria bacterium]|nr:hypothetical protein [Candidatus Saccharibacteria bacterium]
MEEDISLWSRVQILDKKLDCLIDLVGLNGSLIKCVLASTAGTSDKRYQRTVEKYDKMFHDSIIKCGEEIKKIVGDKFENMSAEDAQKLNEAARQTCAFEATSEVGDEA